MPRLMLLLTAATPIEFIDNFAKSQILVKQISFHLHYFLCLNTKNSQPEMLTETRVQCYIFTVRVQCT